MQRILEVRECDALLACCPAFLLDAYVRQEKIFEFFSAPWRRFYGA